MTKAHLMVLLAVLAIGWPSFGVGATTYVYIGGLYTVLTPFTAPCATGPCANFTSAQGIRGQFTTAVPLPPSLPLTNVYASVTSYSFADGINAYSSNDSNSRVVQFFVSTDTSGNVVSSAITIERWLTGSTPHAAGDRFSYFFLLRGMDSAQNNYPCLIVGISLAGVPDSCYSVGSDTAASFAQGAGGSWSILAAAPLPSAPIPVLSEWATGLLALFILGLGVHTLRQRTHP